MATTISNSWLIYVRADITPESYPYIALLSKNKKGISFSGSVHKVCSVYALRSSKAKRFRLVTGVDWGAFWLSRKRLLCYLNTRRNDRISAEFPSGRCLEISAHNDNVNGVLNCPGLPWAADDEIDRRVTQSVFGAVLIVSGEWRGVVLFSSVISMHNILR